MNKNKQYIAPALSYGGMISTAFICGSNDNLNISVTEYGDDSVHDPEELFKVSVPWSSVKTDDDVTAD